MVMGDHVLHDRFQFFLFSKQESCVDETKILQLSRQYRDL